MKALSPVIDVVVRRNGRRALIGRALLAAALGPAVTGGLLLADPSRRAPEDVLAPPQPAAALAALPPAAPALAAALPHAPALPPAPALAPEAPRAPAAAPALEPLALAEIIADDEPEPAPAASAPPMKRQDVRALVSRGRFLEVLDYTVATAPIVPDKVAVHVQAPKREALTAPALAKEDIDFVMRERAGAFRSCYQHALKANAGLRGTFDVSFTIAKDGSVRATKVVAEEKDPRTAGLARCVRGVVQRASFGPTGSGALSVSRTLRFRPDPHDS